MTYSYNRVFFVQLEVEMAGAANESEAKQIRDAFEQRERTFENELDRE